MTEPNGSTEAWSLLLEIKRVQVVLSDSTTSALLGEERRDKSDLSGFRSNVTSLVYVTKLLQALMKHGYSAKQDEVMNRMHRMCFVQFYCTNIYVHKVIGAVHYTGIHARTHSNARCL